MKKIFAFLSFLFFLTLPLLLNDSFVSAANDQGYVPGRVLVKFKDGSTQNDVDKQIRGNNATVVDKIKALGVLVLKVPESAEDKVANALSKNPQVEYAEPDYYAQALWVPNDPYFGKQWGLHNTGQPVEGVVGLADADIDAVEAWDVTKGNVNVKVAILDTGIDNNHEDLAGQVILSKDFTGSASGTNDIYGHGTHVSGIVAAVTGNSVGVAGVCPNCKLINVKVLNDSGYGTYSWVASGITWAADNGAKVINMSLGGSSPSKTLEKAVNYAWGKGVVLVGAAGNSGNQSKTYPGAYTNVIAVAATDNRDKKAYFSEYGSRWVDIAAPGVNVFSTFPNHNYVIGKDLGYDYGSGTSMSTPMVSGVAGLVWSIPTYGTSATAVRSRIELTADDIAGTGTYWSAGRVNAFNAVK
ncbi:MAG: S8 family serine peptidase [Patescibacteria group bacterium]